MELEGKVILVTGAAGFIGASFSAAVLRRTATAVLVGVDNLNAYYDPALKEERLGMISAAAASAGGPGSGTGSSLEAEPAPKRWHFEKGDICDREFLERLFTTYRPSVVVHLAAQAGVRHSVEHPEEYFSANLAGFFQVLDLCRIYRADAGEGFVRHLVYASSSSVYGRRNEAPFSTEDRTDEPASFYAATKKANELMAYSYSATYGLPVTGARFFTAYGPMGRPDMAYFKFAEALMRGNVISLYHYGNCFRDFTYIDDITDALIQIAGHPPGGETDGETGGETPVEVGRTGAVPSAVYNVGGGCPVRLEDFVTILCQKMKKYGLLPNDFDLEHHVTREPLPPGDVELTCADLGKLSRDFGVLPKISIEEGLDRFMKWYAEYQK